MAAVAVAGAGCAGDGPSTGTSQKDVGDQPEIAGDTSAVIDSDSGSPPEDTGGGVDTATDDIADADVTDTEPAGYDIGVELPPAPTGPACSDDDDCEAPTGKCDPLFKVCVECVVGTECGWNRECVDYHCTGPGGQRCLYDWDCLDSPDGHTCKPLEMICTECYEDWQCGSDEVCEDNTCVSGTWQPWCDTTLDCPADKVCNSFTCVECAGREDCADGQWCLNFECVTLPPPAPEPPTANLLPCESDKDCRDYDALCNKAGGFCAVAPALCRTDEQCPDEYTCRGHVCRAKRCYPSEGMCFDEHRDFSGPAHRPGRLIECAADGTRFRPFDDLINCYDLDAGTRDCGYGVGTYDAACGGASQPDAGDVCRDAYIMSNSLHNIFLCACNTNLAPDLCAYRPIP